MSMTLEELGNRLDKAYGDIDCVYIHWTGGEYDQNFNDYHLCIDGEGNFEMTRPFTDIPAATWHRNYRSLAIALNCCKGAQLYADGRTNFGYYPPTEAQVECLAQVVATISDHLHLPIRKGLYMTHAEAAELDEYGPSTTCERWDLWTMPNSPAWGSGGDYIRGKALFYQKQWSDDGDR